MQRPDDVSERSWILLTQAVGLFHNDYTRPTARERFAETFLLVYRAAKQDAIAEMERRNPYAEPAEKRY